MFNYISKYFFTTINNFYDNCLSDNFAERTDVENKTAQTVSLFIGLAAITTAGTIYYFANQRGPKIEDPSTAHHLIQKYQKSLLAEDKRNTPVTIKAKKILKKANILTPKNEEALLVEHGAHAIIIASAMKILQDEYLLTSENRKALLVGGGANALVIAMAIKILHRAKILNENNLKFFLVDGGINARDLIGRIKPLNDSRILTQKNFDALVFHESDSMEDLVDAINLLRRKGILTQKNLEALLAAKSGEIAYQIAMGIEVLHDNHLLNQENQEALLVSGGVYAFGIALGLNSLSNALLLNEKSRKALLIGGGKHTYSIARAIKILDEAHTLTPKTLEALLVGNGKYAYRIAPSIKTLHKTHLLTQATLEALLVGNGKNAYEIARAIKTLHEAHLLAPENQEAFLVNKGKDAYDIAKAIKFLSDAQILTEQNRNVLKAIDKEKLEKLVDAMQLLQDAQILTQGNFEALSIKNLENLEQIVDAMRDLQDEQILTQENFEALLTGNSAYASRIAAALVDLERAHILTPQNRQALLIKKGKQANTIARDLIHAALAPPACYGILRLCLSDVRLHPKQVLRHWSDLPQPPAGFEFLTDAGELQAGVDERGLSAQFYTELTENLLKEGVVFSSIHPKTGMPQNADFDRHTETIAQLGALFKHMFDQKFISGRILPDEFFALLATLKSKKSRLDKQREILKILQIEHASLLQAWLDGDASLENEVLEIFRSIQMDPDLHLSEEKLREEAELLLKEILSPYLKIGEALLSGISGWLDYQLTPDYALEISSLLQGNPLDPDAMIAAFRIHSENPDVLQKVEWIKERIHQEALMKDSNWRERLAFCVMSQRALKSSDTIEIYESSDERCRARTCFKSLYIPTNASTKEEFFEKLDELMADESYSMA